MHMAWAQHDTFFISHVCKYACACKIDDIKFIVQSYCHSHVYTRYVHDNVQTHTCMSEMHTPNLDCMHF